MDTYTLEKVLGRLVRTRIKSNQTKIIFGVYPCDSLKLRSVLKKQNTTSARAIIVNTDESTKSGTHWQALFIPARKSKEKRRTCYFFDSYGRPPTNNYIREYIKSLTHVTHWNSIQLQAYNSLYCGEWCCVFLSFMLRGIGMNKFYDHFSTTDFKLNDDTMMYEFCRISNTLTKKPKIRQICCAFQMDK